MKEYNVPHDITKYVQANVKKLIAKWLGLTLLIGAGIFFINTRANQLSYKNIPIHITIFLLILPVFITKAYKLFDKSWVGIIEDIKPIYNVKYPTNGYTKYSYRAYTESLVLLIQTQTGKLKTVKAFEHTIAHSHEQTPSKPSAIMEHYQIGDKVIHIGGTRFLQVVDSQPQKSVCIVCGSLEDSEKSVCSQCGHTLKITRKSIVHY